MNRLGLALLLAAAPVAAQERSLVIEKFDATIKVNADASLDITEAITPRFTGHWNGIFRTIPIEYRTPQGFNWTIRFDLVSVTDDQGNELKVEKSRERHYLKLKIWVPGAEDATRHVVLKYRAKNGLRFFDDHDELYWNVTGDEWEVPIEKATSTIELPSGAQGVRAISFNGAYGATDKDALITKSGTSVHLEMPHPLAFHEGMTAVVGWNKGVVTAPTAADKIFGFLASNWPLIIPIPVFFAMLSVWRKRGRDPRQLPISVQYDPPEHMTPAEAGTLLDNSADMRDITATLVDLAVRGYIRIEEKEEAKLFGLIKDKEFVFHRLKGAAEWTSLKEHETAMLGAVFADGPTVALSQLENEFYRSLPGIKNAIFGALIERDCYKARPDSVQGAWIAGAMFVGFGIGVGGSALADNFSMTPLPFIIAGVLSGLIMAAFGIYMPARTVTGARTLEKILGFEEFMNRVEGDRLRDFVKTPEMFERFLPYAMAFGVEKKWAAAFQDIMREPPRWYAGAGYGQFNASVFSNRLSTMATQASSTMSSSPRSSSGSGFSGGSSGGGGGGGGGGGF